MSKSTKEYIRRIPSGTAEKIGWILSCILLVVAAAAAGFWADNGGMRLSLLFGGIMLFAALVFSGLHDLALLVRKRRLRDLSEELDAVLHGSLSGIGSSEEGELAVLKNEISKLLLRLRDTMDLLKKEKTALADSMADISHQLRTPLTSVRLIATMLSKPGLEEARRAELSRDLRQILSATEWLLEALLKLSRIDAGTVRFAKTAVPLKTVLDKAASPLLLQMELRGLIYSLRLPENECLLEVDPLWTAEAISNILKNCTEHTPPGGRITVTVTENPLYIGVTVEDTGEGFSAEDLPHIFERFYKGKNAKENGSFGIGLSLCRRILSDQNATVKAENRSEGGAKFSVKFYKSVV